MRIEYSDAGRQTAQWCWEWSMLVFREDGSPLAASGCPSPHQNQLLDALPASDYQRVASHLELIPMKLGDVLYESGATLQYVYFPTTTIISLLYVMGDGASAEIAIVGNEGILGISLFMGGDHLS